MVIYGVGDSKEETMEDHNKNLRVFLKRCRSKGIKLNKHKLKLACSEIPYMGHLVTDKDLKADPDKVIAVTNMLVPDNVTPDNVTTVQRLCRFINYLAKFLPNLSDVMEPLRQLTRQDIPQEWKHKHQTAFEQVKSMVTSAPLLKNYDPSQELTIQCDASQRGLGAALLQEGRPIVFASRTLTDAKTRYTQIEKEMLAVVVALQKSINMCMAIRRLSNQTTNLWK